MRLLALALALLAVPALLQARAPREMIEIKADDPVSIRPDRAYILFRIFRPDGAPSTEPILLRIPHSDEMERYLAARRAAFVRAEPGLVRQREAQIRRNAEAARDGRIPGEPDPPPPSIATFNFVYEEIQNLQAIDQSRALVRGRPESILLVEVVPGDYVLYGASYGQAGSQLYVCMCLGTVGFSAQPGVVTDLGTFLGDTVERISSIPELRAESGFGPGSTAIFRLLGATMRPPQPGAAVPEVLRNADIHPARYRAVGKFLEPRALAINRLAPIPGVLAYDEGRVVDVASGRIVPDNY
jgi:hypothetical protein